MMQLYNADCLEGMKGLERESIDLIVTDPPYLVNYKTGRRKTKGHRFSQAILNDKPTDEGLITGFISEAYRILKPNAAMYMFCSADRVDFFKQELEEFFTIKNMIIWEKNSHTAGDLEAAFGRKYEILFLVNKGRAKFNGKRLTDVWHFDRITGPKQLHQNEKPLDLIGQCIEKHSQPGDLVLDGFAGSGTTGVACKNLGRQFIGYELDPGYFEIARDRLGLADLTAIDWGGNSLNTIDWS